jgi:phosphoglycerate dehydrogenase-like enzyme
MIGRRVATLLRNLDVHVIAYDPFCSPAAAKELGVELVGSLTDVFVRSRVVSLHAPIKPETTGMITGELVGMLPPGGALINTARGILVREDELIAVLRKRTDLSAILDVVYPEPAAPDSPLYDLPNVFLTSHIAGSAGGECARMGRYMVDECRRFLAKEPLQWSVSREAFARMA